MSDWVSVCKADDLQMGEQKVVDVDDTAILVARIGEGERGVVAVEDLCSHEELPLSGGTIEGDRIVCPMHGAMFCLRTGAALSAPAYEAISVLPVRVLDGWVQVRDDRWD